MGAVSLGEGKGEGEGEGKGKADRVAIGLEKALRVIGEEGGSQGVHQPHSDALPLLLQELGGEEGGLGGITSCEGKFDLLGRGRGTACVPCLLQQVYRLYRQRR